MVARATAGRTKTANFRLRKSWKCMNKKALDSTDIRILSAVQRHGQLSKARLAELVNLSPTSCWTRLERLKSEGFIRAYQAELALDRITEFTQVVVTVSLKHHRKSDFERFESYIYDRDEVIDCISTGGGMDYVMKIAAPSLSAFQILMDEMLCADLAIDRYMTYIATRQIKHSQPNLTQLVMKNIK